MRHANFPTFSRSATMALVLALGVSLTGAGCTSMDETTGNSQQPVEDTWITTKVMAELATVNGVESTDIGVETSNGVVTLTGRADSKAQIDQIVAAAGRIDGVIRVDAALVQVAP